jgi:WD40 repeat protein
MTVAFAADGTSLMSAVNDTLQVWRPADGVRTRSQKLAISTHWPNEHVTSARFSADGTLLALAICDRAGATGACDNAEIRLWHTGDGGFVGALRGQRNTVTGLAFSKDGALLVSGSCHTLSTVTTTQCMEGDVMLWRVSDRKSLYEARGHGDWVTGLAFSNDGVWIASGARDGSVNVRRVSDGGRLLDLQHGAEIDSLIYTRDDGMLVAGATPTALWLMPGGIAVDSAGWPAEVKQLVISPDGSTLAVGGDWDNVGLWRIK